ncbi:MAG TPA: O-antigen ligase family protein, partial [Caldilineae bacterium]|nr:O-antigen ligase family protein [Caldilineae bacterium]
MLKVRELAYHPIVQAAGRVALVVLIGALGLGLGLILVSPDWPLAVTLVGLSAILLLVFMDPLDGFLAWMVLAPYARFIYLDIKLGRGIPDLGLTRLCAGLLTLIILAQMARRQRQPLPINWIDVMALAFGVGLIISAFSAFVGPISAVQTVVDFFGIPMLIYYLARHLVRRPQDLERALTAMLIIGAYLAALTTHEQLTGVVLFRGGDWGTRYSPHIRKVIGLLGNPASMGTAQAVLLPFAAYTGLYGSSPTRRWAGRLVTLMLLVGIGMTYVRAAWLAALVALLIFGVYDRRLRRVVLPAYLIVALLVFLFWGALSQSWVVRERLSSYRPIEYRLTAFSLTWRMIAHNPLFGIGYGNFGRAAMRLYGWDPDRNIYVDPSPHNTFLFILASGGFVALL